MFALRVERGCVFLPRPALLSTLLRPNSGNIPRYNPIYLRLGALFTLSGTVNIPQNAPNPTTKLLEQLQDFRAQLASATALGQRNAEGA